jgi:indolepyruvate ferredoxin oxidoreductase beta subunit
MDTLNIYLCGVGGQGIGLLSEVMIRSAVDAGYQVMGADTHGLAQRGGTVASHLRLGEHVFTPIVPAQQADIVLALERLEGLRALQKMLKPGGTLMYYDSEYQQISVRTGQEKYPTNADVQAAAKKRGATAIAVSEDDLPDPRMQNVVLIGHVARAELIEKLTPKRFEQVLRSVVPPKVLEQNLAVFLKATAS